MEREHRREKVKQALLCMQRYSWEQGVTAQAFLEAGEDDLAIICARAAVMRQNGSGLLGNMNEPAVTDPAANGEAVLLAARATGEESLRAAVEAQTAWLLSAAPRTADGVLYHFTDKKEVWVDAYYMAPPFLAAVGRHAEALAQVEGFRRLLWNPAKKLFSHIWSDEKKDFTRQAFWGTGNGWAAAGMTRVIKLLPDGMSKEKERLAGYVTECLEGCLAFLRPDGLFHDVVDDPGTFVETNLSQMLSYTIYRGATAGWLDRSYLPAADRMREAAYGKVDNEGLVRDVCGAPHFDRPGIAPEGQAFFLLMEAAEKDLRSGS